MNRMVFFLLPASTFLSLLSQLEYTKKVSFWDDSYESSGGQNRLVKCKSYNSLQTAQGDYWKL